MYIKWKCVQWRENVHICNGIWCTILWRDQAQSSYISFFFLQFSSHKQHKHTCNKFYCKLNEYFLNSILLMENKNNNKHIIGRGALNFHYYIVCVFCTMKIYKMCTILIKVDIENNNKY